MPGMSSPRIRTTTVGSYPVPEWLSALPSEQARLDATRVIFGLQQQAGIDLPTDGELYRFDVNHPDTNGMIEYFIRPLAGISTAVGASVWRRFRRPGADGFPPQARRRGHWRSSGEGGLNLSRRLHACRLRGAPGRSNSP